MAEARALTQPSIAAFNPGASFTMFKYDSIEEAFPPVDPGLEPMGSLVLVQVRQPKRKTRGGIILTAEDRATEFYNTQVAKVIAIGACAFRNRQDMTLWPEGAWCKVGDFVRIPKYQGDRFTVPYETVDKDIVGGITRTVDTVDETCFILFKDLAMLGRYTGDPLTVKCFL